jgi:hypothetical protein
MLAATRDGEEALLDSGTGELELRDLRSVIGVKSMRAVLSTRPARPAPSEVPIDLPNHPAFP